MVETFCCGAWGEGSSCLPMMSSRVDVVGSEHVYYIIIDDACTFLTSEMKLMKMYG